MFQSHKLSFYIIIGLIFIMPLFFVPGSVLALGIAKSALITFGIILASIVFVFELWKQGNVVMPKHYFIAAVVAMPVVYLLSALLATPSSLSLFGYGLEVGTFGFMLLGTILLLLVSSVFVDTARTLQAFVAFFFSLSILAAFAGLKIILGGDSLTMGNFFGVVGNPLGSWADMAIVFGLLSLFSALTLGMIPMNLSVKILLYASFALSTILLVVLGFSTALLFTLITSILMALYFLKIETEGNKRAIWLPVILGVVSLIFFVNPTINAEDKKLGELVSDYTSVNNSEVKPSFSATLSISKAVLSQSGLLGSGPNTFGHDWLIFKSANINATPFWASEFPFGAGFIPTQIATTGILGSALWLVFLVFMVILAVRAFSKVPSSRAERYTLVFTLLGSLFLWAAAFLYTPSASVLLLAFIFTGLFIAALMREGMMPVYNLDFKSSAQGRMALLLVVAVVAIGALGLGWVSYGKTLSAYHYNSAVRLSGVEGGDLAQIEGSLIKAIGASPTDVFYLALSQFNFSRAQQAAQNASSTPEENQKVFEESIRKSIEAARLAVNVNPAGYQNWTNLGSIFSSLVAEPVALEGAYENALYAYNEAARRNPSNPQTYLQLAQLEINKKEVDKARTYIYNAINLKQDYAEAYLALAQLEIGAGNTEAAIASTEKLALLQPDNAGVHFELGLLKYSSEDYEAAVLSLERAIEIAADFANAKYYLGLSQAQLGNFADAQTLFEGLLANNSENTELISALEAVKAGKVPTPPPTEETTEQ